MDLKFIYINLFINFLIESIVDKDFSKSEKETSWGWIRKKNEIVEEDYQITRLKWNE